ncbi:hypothetical protein L5515_016017 [Caenorhabditis briggsae]|uniref:Uncharacterized protein n=1 Tax=Caenorhabditis briggsae TaxID=6238 RepID=A0AAE9IWK6_CAEBR|nr:hypothetical protein L3Y34_019927 [Caenorhabditis briggsae]UMM20961.1 hypothetical protein L5515_016017 [Caenorhabditis briggsae]
MVSSTQLAGESRPPAFLVFQTDQSVVYTKINREQSDALCAVTQCDLVSSSPRSSCHPEMLGRKEFTLVFFRSASTFDDRDSPSS